MLAMDCESVGRASRTLRHWFFVHPVGNIPVHVIIWGCLWGRSAAGDGWILITQSVEGRKWVQSNMVSKIIGLGVISGRIVGFGLDLHTVAYLTYQGIKTQSSISKNTPSTSQFGLEWPPLDKRMFGFKNSYFVSKRGLTTKTERWTPSDTITSHFDLEGRGLVYISCVVFMPYIYFLTIINHPFIPSFETRPFSYTLLNLHKFLPQGLHHLTALFCCFFCFNHIADAFAH